MGVEETQGAGRISAELTFIFQQCVPKLNKNPKLMEMQHIV